jgi:DNA-binding CsgD family transcriptional regulator/pimeloyl-ACP methyl ester carboxylesterase
MDAPPVQYVRTSDGYDIAYMVSGEGRPFLLMPGPVTHIGLFWRSLAMRGAFEELAARFRLIQYDARGQGLSMRGLRDGLALEDWERDIEAVANRENLDHFVLGSFSSNAYVAADYTLRHPQQIDALIVWNVPLVRQTVVPSTLDDMSQENWEFFVDATARTTFPWEEPATAKKIVLETWTQADWLARSSIWRNVRIEEALSRLRVPTLVLATRADAWRFGTETDSRKIAAMIPDARLVVFDEPGGGFFGYGAETPPAPRAIEDFLRDVESRNKHRVEVPVQDTQGNLSEREIEVLRLLAAGKSNAQIADELVISQNTAIRHVSNIFAKIGAENRAQAAVYARDRGIG